MKTNYETRALSGIELRDAAKDSGFVATLTGYAARFNSDSAPIMNEGRKRPFIERIAPGAFGASLTEKRDAGSEVLALWSHDESQPIGRRGANLRLEEDGQGLRFELDVPDTQAGRDLVTNVRAKIVTGVSFGFRAQEETVERGVDFDTRTLRKVKLFEVSPTAVPAYAATSIDFRSHDRLCEASAETRALTVTAEGATEQKPAPAAEPTFPLRSLWAARLGLRN